MILGRPFFFMTRLRNFSAAALSRRDHCLQDLTFVIHGTPEIAEPAVDSHEHLIQMPAPRRIAAHLHDLPLADLSGRYRAKPHQNRTVS
jgi:hypothetical protein